MHKSTCYITFDMSIFYRNATKSEKGMASTCVLDTQHNCNCLFVRNNILLLDNALWSRYIYLHLFCGLFNCIDKSFFIIIFTERDKFDAINLMVYIFNSVIMFVELMTVTHPVNLSHTYWTMSIGVIYTIFTVIYYIAGGTSR